MQRSTKQKNSGFTLIELIVVITIIGILAAVAIPRLSNLEREARIASVQGLLGAVKSAAMLAHATSLVQGAPATISMEAQVVNMLNEYPTAAANGIARAIAFDAIDYTFSAGTPSTFTLSGYSGSNCEVRYSAADGSGAPPAIVAVTSGC
ncbi:type IV pilin protein [Gilvimarinus polysaccharolyticus]|uniref:type IV pilin protein n=1 Tax=Gilvimarinus polysaccharolyticus TaxID=863921 RepID=UPI0006732414|nr:prepilin-type N-terminal cleavage/methylation domain-containing protein [Gilvimarinus polysaccharolyticus]